MVKVLVGNTTIAESSSTIVVEGNHYFPPQDIKKEFFSKAASQLTTHCPWKGDASYYDIKVGDELIPDSAWYYPEAFEKAKNIENYVAFYKNKVQVVE
ncbi:hypothetical protein JCM10207_004523 [Rhodosporidiobolus poonsookiae]